MSLVPAFDIGLWNAWIFITYSLLPLFAALPLAKGREKDSNFTAGFSRMQKNAHRSFHLTYLIIIIYSIFLPLELGTAWFYAGLPICVIGLLPYTIGFINVATTQVDKPITKGIYRYSRHPMYLTSFLTFIGVGIASASWIFLLFSLLYVILMSIFVVPEERFCLQYYGDAYRDYMEKTPRWLGFPKSG